MNYLQAPVIYRLAPAVLALTLIALPACAKELRIPASQATQGLPLVVTHDFDRIIRFEGDSILDAWLSNPVLFLPRFNKGGAVIVIQSTASPKELRVLPQLGRTLGTLTVEMQSGRVLVFLLQYTPTPPKTPILTLYSPPAPGPTLAPAIQAYQQRNQEQAQQRTALRPQGVVRQPGFKAPVVQSLPASPAPVVAPVMQQGEPDSTLPLEEEGEP
ncbi:hypothetical protein [Candidatus Cyanaurora vandensis]|uniref:hypothetical protein n=1 Tax=Candidatus Cyanaurora vandensis TaxID=2714958 RepID=UPI002579AC3A|nr:hypothetical protein [Candidatus Cyanaurora vandensis]